MYFQFFERTRRNAFLVWKLSGFVYFQFEKKKENSLHCRLDSMLNPLSNSEMDYWLSCWKKIHLSRMKPIGFGVKLLIRGNISMHKVDVDGSYQMVMEFESPCVSIWNVSEFSLMFIIWKVIVILESIYILFAQLTALDQLWLIIWLCPFTLLYCQLGCFRSR